MPGCLNLGRARTAESRRAQAGQELEPRRIARRCWGERITDHTPVAHHGQVAFAACRLARRATRACRSRAGTRESTRLAARLPPSLHPAAAPRPTIAHCCFPCPGTLASASAVGAAAPLLPPECGTVGPAAGGCRNSSNSAARGHWRGRMSLLLQSRSSSLDVRFRCSSQGRSAGVGGRRARSREGGRRVLSRLSPPHRAFIGRVLRDTRAPPPPGKAPVCRRSARKGFPSVRSIRLAWWSTGPRCGLTDDFSAPCWSVREYRLGRLTPCGN
jgi:hypothetical protein